MRALPIICERTRILSAPLGASLYYCGHCRFPRVPRRVSVRHNDHDKAVLALLQVWPMKIIKVAMQNNEPGWYPPPGENNQTAKYTLTELGLCPRDVPPQSAYTWYAIRPTVFRRTSLCRTSGDMAV